MRFSVALTLGSLFLLTLAGCGGSGGSSNSGAIRLRSIPLSTNSIRYDAGRQKLWASTPGGTVVMITPSTGSISTPITVGADPGTIAISDDNSRLFVSIRSNGHIKTIDTTSQAIVQDFAIAQSFGEEMHAYRIAVQPGSNSTIAVTTNNGGTGGFGPEIYDNGVARPNKLNLYEGNHLAWVSASKIAAADGETTAGSLFECAVDSQGATKSSELTNVFSNFIQSIAIASNRIYASDGTVVNATDFSVVGKFPYNNYSPTSGTVSAGPVIDSSKNRAYFIQFGLSGDRLFVFALDTLTLVASKQLPSVAGLASFPYLGDVSLTQWGTKGLAFRTTSHVYFIDDTSSL